MSRANDCAIEVMGEDLVFGEAEIKGIVDPISIDESKGVGGKKSIISASVLISAEVELRDGMPVVIRGADGKVESWTRPSAEHVMVNIGPFNRWSGEIPGV